MTERRCGVVIVNYYDRARSLSLAARLIRGGVTPKELVLVDNSGDCDGEAVGFCYIRLPNVGYAAAVNAAIKSLALDDDDALLVLTPRIDFSCVGSLLRMHEALDVDGGCAAVGPLLLDSNVPRARPFAGIIGELPGGRRNTYEPSARASARYVCVDALDGACWCISARAVKEVGALNEEFFLYWEDVEWCTRASLSGWRILVDTSFVVEQEAGYLRPLTGYYAARNRILVSRMYERSSGTGWFIRTAVKAVAAVPLRTYPAAPFFRAQGLGLLDGFLGRRGTKSKFHKYAGS